MAKKSIPVPALSPARKPSPSPAAVDALCVLLSTYIDLNVPTPQELLDLLPEDAFTAGSAQPAGKIAAPRRLIPACFSPRYSAATPTASMRKLGPVAWHAVAEGLAEIYLPEPVDPIRLRWLHAPEYVDAFMAGKAPWHPRKAGHGRRRSATACWPSTAASCSEPCWRWSTASRPTSRRDFITPARKRGRLLHLQRSGARCAGVPGPQGDGAGLR